MSDSKKIVFMGVCGVGKTTFAERLAEHLGCSHVVEADAFHPKANKDKMAAGIPLNDDDRWPWLDSLNRAMQEDSSPYVIVTCSALRSIYRDRLCRGLEGAVQLILLDAPREVIFERMKKRVHEYMPTSLLESQLALLERPQSEESVAVVSVEGTPDEVFERILGVVGA